jgi:hypothetical protein
MHALDRLQVGDVSLRSRLASGYDELTPSARRVFQQICCEESPVVRPRALTASLGLPVYVIEDLLEIFVDAGLIQHAPTAGQYRMSSLFRLYGAERSRLDEQADDVVGRWPMRAARG